MCLLQEMHEVTKPHVRKAVLERRAIEGDSPVFENVVDFEMAPEYRGTRETLWESGGTTLQG